MADEKCSAADVVAASMRVYDMALELSTLIDAFAELEPQPKWAFALSAYAGRLTNAADEAHGVALRAGLPPAALAVAS